MKLLQIISVLGLFVLFGCADSSQQGDMTERDYDQRMNITNDAGIVVIYFPVRGASDTDTDSTQKTSANASISPNTSASLAQAGATSNAAVGELIENIVEGVTNAFTPSTDNSDNSTEVAPVVPVIVPDKEKVVVDPEAAANMYSEEYNTKDTISGLRFAHNKPFKWHEETGAYYGGAIKIRWPGCGGAELDVPDATVSYSPKGHEHETWFCGTDQDIKDKGENNGIRASSFGPASCKPSATDVVEIYYNK